MKYQTDISSEDLDQIERFLRDEMTHEEVTTFSDRIRSDQNIRSKVDEIRLTVLGISEAVLSDKLDGYHRETKPGRITQKNKQIYFWKWAMAASLILIVATSAWWTSSQLNSNQQLYSRYYKPDPGLMTVMSSGNGNYTFEKAMVEYKSGDYKKALAAWTQLLRDKPGNDTLLYFSGVASQASGDFEGTVRYLRPVADNDSSDFQKDACWYLGLAYLQKKEEVKAIEFLRKSKHAKSEQLINNLSN